MRLATWHKVASVAYLVVRRTRQGGHEMCLSAGREKKWASSHECEGLKEGVWPDPVKTMLRRMTKEEWTDKHRNMMQ